MTYCTGDVRRLFDFYGAESGAEEHKAPPSLWNAVARNVNNGIIDMVAGLREASYESFE